VPILAMRVAGYRSVPIDRLPVPQAPATGSVWCYRHRLVAPRILGHRSVLARSRQMAESGAVPCPPVRWFMG
jgi:hypothetical protein